MSQWHHSSAFPSLPLCVLCVLCALCVEKNRCQAGETQDPETERASFKVHEGYEVNLFASEKDGIVKPIQLRWDAQGRLFVACSPSYPQLEPGQKPDDMLVMLEDPQRTGRATKSTVFARGLNTPMGLEAGDGGIYAGTGNELIHLKDTNGDGVADERKTILRGFFTADSHQNINSFVWSPSGELYFCQGLHASSRVETVFGVERLEKAGVWRYTPRTGKLDPFLGWDTGPQNPFGIVFDDYGQPLMVAGNGQGVYYLKPALIRTDNRIDPKQIWTKSNKLGGADIIGTQHFPPETQGRMVSGCYLNNALYWFEISDDGAGFRVKDLPPLIVSTSTNFRAVDVRFGPDGALYVADWFNPIIGHYQASFRHPQRDKAHGRIWRITAKGRPLVTPPELTKMKIPELLEQLKSPERWVRYQAKRLLFESEKPIGFFEQMAKWADSLDKTEPNYERVLIDLGNISENLPSAGFYSQQMMESRDPRVRATVPNRLIGEYRKYRPSLDFEFAGFFRALDQCARDPHPRVRLAAVVAASYVPLPRCVKIVAVAAHREVDPFLKYAMTQAVHALKPYWKPALESGALSFADDPQGLEFILKADGSKDALKPVLKLLESDKLEVAQRTSLLQVVIRVGGPDELGKVLSNLSSNPILLDEFVSAWQSRKVKPAGEISENLRMLLSSPDLQVRSRATTLIGIWRVESLRADLESVVSGRRNLIMPEPALQALASLGGDKSRIFFERLWQSDLIFPEKVTITVAWIELDLKAAARAAVAVFEGENPTLDPAPLVNGFLQHDGGSAILAAALANAAVIRDDTAKLALRAISAAGRQDTELVAVFSRAARITNEEIEYSADYVKKLADEVTKSGDAHRGENVFRGTVTNCLSCHAVSGVGATIGPDLGEIGTGMPLDMLIEAVLWPNRQVKEGYMSTLVVTKDGLRTQGIKLSDDKQEIVLRDPGTDTRARIPAAEVKTKKDIGSIMPSGLTSGLTREEVRDLIRFLSELGRPGDFRVSNAPVVRRFDVLSSYHEPFEGTYGSKVLDHVLKADEKQWSSRMAKVSGELPAADFVQRSGTTWLRFKVEVVKEGKFVLRGSPSDSELFLNNQSLKNGIPADLHPGTYTVYFPHTLLLQNRDFLLSLGKSGSVQVRIEPAPNSTGEIRILNR